MPRNKLARAILALFTLSLVLIGAMSGCAPRPTGTQVVGQPDEIAIYAAVIRRLYGEDDTFGGTLQPPHVYVVRGTDDSVGDSDAPQDESRVIALTAQAAIAAALADLPTTISWVDSRDDVPFDASAGAVADGGVIVTLGNIHLRDDGSALVAGSIYIALLASGGQTYVLEEIDGEWQITGNTGTVWIS